MRDEGCKEKVFIRGGHLCYFFKIISNFPRYLNTLSFRPHQNECQLTKIWMKNNSVGLQNNGKRKKMLEWSLHTKIVFKLIPSIEKPGQ